MLRSTTVQMLAVLAVGALGGWLVASGRLQPGPSAGAPPGVAAPACCNSAPEAPCCAEGAGRGELLARADVPARAVAAALNQPAKGGKQPNILVIFGDDI